MSEKQQVLYMTIGVPGSGKSTWVNRQNLPTVNPDAIRREICGRSSEQSRNREVWQLAYERLTWLFQNPDPYWKSDQYTVVLDSTMATRRNRLEAIEFCALMGVRVQGFFFDVTLDEALYRNGNRENPVPNGVIVRMHNQLISEPPDQNEGFDCLVGR